MWVGMNEATGTFGGSMSEVERPMSSANGVESEPAGRADPARNRASAGEIPTEASSRRDGTGLALSGGGYRASLFGRGSLWRLNGLGLLPMLRRITSVSGGSITAGVLAARWSELNFDDNGYATNFDDIVAHRVMEFCSHTLDRKAILSGLVPFVSAAGIARRVYES